MKHIAKKRFGQNFLTDQAIIHSLISAIGPHSTDCMVEIGPGLGAMTRPLVDKLQHLHVVEIDRDIIEWMQTAYPPGKLTIHASDALKFDFGSIAPKLRVVGNLPYNISTPCMFHLLQFQEWIADMTFMLQLEVVQRLAALPGDEHYGRLGLMMQYYCTVEHLFDVPGTAFIPQPKVCSAIVRLVPHRHPPVQVEDVQCLQEVVRVAFTQRRKTLKNSLRTLISEAQLNTLPIDTGLRPENLSLADYAMISDCISRSRTTAHAAGAATAPSSTNAEESHVQE